MATATHSPRSWTPDDVRALPDDGKRYECIDGELLVTPSPRLVHQRAVYELLLLVGPYVRAHRIGESFFSPADVSLDERALVQPDLFVVSLIDGHRPREWRELRWLVLAVEIISPSSARADRGVKRRLYQRWDTGEYWVVDLDARVVERWRPTDERPEIADSTLRWQPDSSIAPLDIALEPFFAAVLDAK